MKRSIIALGILVVVMLQSCIIKSIHPFFSEKDVVFKADLIDTWEDQDGNKWVIRSEKPNEYEMILNREGRQEVFKAHLFKLDDQLYVDFLPSVDKTGGFLTLHLLPTHSVAKVELEKNEVTIKWFNEAWLGELFEQNRVKISHEEAVEQEAYVLTASTAELQKFLIKFGSDPKAFDQGSNSVYLKLKRAI